MLLVGIVISPHPEYERREQKPHLSVGGLSITLKSTWDVGRIHNKCKRDLETGARKKRP